MKDAALLFKALADGTRLRILTLLGRGELCVCDLTAVLGLPQSTVSRHLAYLRNAGWIKDRRRGVWMYYRLSAEGPPLQRELLALLQERLTELPGAPGDLAALDRYLRRKTEHPCP